MRTKVEGRHLYLIITPAHFKLKDIQKVRAINHIKMTFERHENKKLIIQCHKCQTWGHATFNFMLQSRCLKCAGNHFTRKCKPKNQIKYVKCQKDHPANSVECEKYKVKIEQIQRRRTKKNNNYNNYNNNRNIQQYIPAPLPTVNPWTARTSEPTRRNENQRPLHTQPEHLYDRETREKPTRTEWSNLPQPRPSRLPVR